MSTKKQRLPLKGATPNISQMLGTKVTKNYRKSNAVKHLEQLDNDAARLKNPTIPVEWLAKRTHRDDTANGLTKCIITFVRLKGYQAERISNTGRIIDNRKSYTDVLGRTQTVGSTTWIPSSGTRGTADLACTIAGRSVKVEVKIGKDRQSEAQKLYQQSVESAGGIYLIATSFEQFFVWYNLKFANNAT